MPVSTSGTGTVAGDISKPASHLLADPLVLVACGFGSGLSPLAPGTVGTLAAAALYLLLPEAVAPALLWGLLAVALLAGIPLCEHAARRFGGDDPAAIVWDEWVGCWLALALAPTGWHWLLATVALFRLLDILKPWPISYLDRLHGGVGIMLDDALAGLFAGGALSLVALFI